jgi:inhibitor of cysteine peptidase
MKYKTLFTAVAVVVTAFLAACSKDDAPKKTDAPVKNNSAVEKAINIDAEGNSKTIHVLPGKTICVKLKANHTTGYSWSLAAVDKSVLEVGEEGEYESDPHPEGMVGVGGNEVWSFKAIAAGETEISLVYVRPWEKDEPPAMTFNLKVIVDKP